MKRCSSRDHAALLHGVMSAFVFAPCFASCVPPAPGEQRPEKIDHSVIDDVVPPDAALTRARRRLTVDQLEQSLLRSSGGIEWLVDGSNGFERMSATLGKPDYIQSTREDLGASTIFMKFLGDAAESVCGQLVVVDLQRPRSQRALFLAVEARDLDNPSSEQIDENLKRLLLRFHGRHPSALATDLEAWRWLYQNARETGGDASLAWQTICVALISHPDFYTY